MRTSACRRRPSLIVSAFLISHASLIRGFLRVVRAAAAQHEARRYRVEPTGAQGVAAQDTPNRKQTAAQWAEPCDRHLGVARTGRMEAALAAEQRAQQALVDRDQEQQQAGQDDDSLVDARYTTRSVAGRSAPRL